jgi:hypothetical protein
MRYLFGLLCVCALCVVPLSASAQEAEEHGLSFWHDEALKIALFSSSPPPPPPRPPDGYTREAMELRVNRAAIGLIASASLLAVGAIVMGSAAWAPATCTLGEPCAFTNRMVAGGSLMTIGAIGMIISGVWLARRKRDLASLRYAHHGRPRRVQWDLARSRIVF